MAGEREYPYGYWHEINLDWILEQVKSYQEKLNAYKLTYKDDLANHMAEYTKMYNKLNDIQAALLSAVSSHPDFNLFPSIITVGQRACRFQKIQDAIEYAKQYANTYTVTILVSSGIYNESINMQNTKGINLVGIGNPTIIANRPYPEAGIYISGNATVEGITFINNQPNNASYGMHIEQGNDNPVLSNMALRFVNCRFISTGNSVGIGTGMSTEIRFEECKFFGTVYLHNSVVYPGNSLMFFHDCYINGRISVDSYKDNTNSFLNIEFTNVVHNGDIEYRVKSFSAPSEPAQTYDYLPFKPNNPQSGYNKAVFLLNSSKNNGKSYHNYVARTFSCTVPVLNNGLAIIDFPDVKHFTLAGEQYQDENYQPVTEITKSYDHERILLQFPTGTKVIFYQAALRNKY